MSTPKKYWFRADRSDGAKLDRKSLPKAWREDVPETPEPYIPAPGLERAVNLAIHLGRPLLLEGEAGCGKTRLARAVAYKLGLPFYPWYVNSASRARDGLYSFDSLLRLHHVQIFERLSADRQLHDPSDPKNYRRWEALGKAFAVARQGERAVVLIDEIDKADTDFPNDLLTVLDDDFKFTVPETNELVSARREGGSVVKPIVIITSNREKGDDLPGPFLRRCLYFYVKFPDEAALRRIVAEHAGDAKKQDDPLVKAAVDRFSRARADLKLRRKPGTSEFLDWLKALETFGPEFSPRPFAAEELLTANALPFPEAMFKTHDDWRPHADATT
ncbi:MAG: AAA family ATPase [Blastocatellia bacterium]